MARENTACGWGEEQPQGHQPLLGRACPLLGLAARQPCCRPRFSSSRDSRSGCLRDWPRSSASLSWTYHREQDQPHLKPLPSNDAGRCMQGPIKSTANEAEASNMWPIKPDEDYTI